MKISLLKKIAFIVVIVLTLPPPLQANTLSLGYAQTRFTPPSSINDKGDINNKKGQGINARLNYMIDNDWGIITALTYTQREGKTESNNLGKQSRVTQTYGSLSVGPSYRFSHFLSVYSSVGIAVTNSYLEQENSGSRRQNGGGKKRRYTSKENDWGGVASAGFQFTPGDKWVIDIGYEYAQLRDNRAASWIAGVGYHF
jgi:opacity protein-like surface antigen